MEETANEQMAFASACEAAANTLRGQNGIGSLGEKTLHLTLKYFYEPNAENHERPLQGYVADVFGERGVVEIQTAQTWRLKPKLAAFLPVSDVLVVCPLATEKWVIWVDPVSGSISEKRRSPGSDRPLAAVGELYGLKEFLLAPGFSVELVLLSVEEYRLLDGYGAQKKKRATKYEKLPTALHARIRLQTPADYAALLSIGLPEQFTSKELKTAAKLRLPEAQKALNVLFALGVVERVGKQGQAYLYRKKSGTEDAI